jgi:twitching motility protein PilT
MNLESLIRNVRSRGASDLHVEAGLPLAARIRGELLRVGDSPSASDTRAMAQSLLEGDTWQQFVARRSADFSRTLAGVRCRINLLYTSHGIGLAIRLLARSIPTLETLNLNSELRELIAHEHGLVLVSGPTGCGKSSTLAALIEEINVNEHRHVITLEDPIEYSLRSKRAFIRQREVGTHTPSFQQGLLDALREDPDVLMVGEMRHPEVMRLTLNFAETGHLVFATVHSANTIEALQRVAMAFPPESQSVVCAQLADSLIAVIAQRLVYRSDLRIRVPECEILVGSPPVRNLVRQGNFYKLESALTTGAREGMYTFERYQGWMASRARWHVPSDADGVEETVETAAEPPPTTANAPAPVPPARPVLGDDDVINLEPAAEDIADFVSRLKPLSGQA